MQVRHDVMSHVYAYGVQCPTAKPIIHLGATSCYVGDNTDVITMREALLLIKKKLVNAIASVAKFADQYKDMLCLGFTHFQPAQPTTVGKRATLWLMDLVMDYEEVRQRADTLMSAVGGTTAPAPVSERLTATTRSARRWIVRSQRRWASRPASRSAAKPMPASWTPLCATAWG